VTAKCVDVPQGLRPELYAPTYWRSQKFLLGGGQNGKNLRRFLVMSFGGIMTIMILKLTPEMPEQAI